MVVSHLYYTSLRVVRGGILRAVRVGVYKLYAPDASLVVHTAEYSAIGYYALVCFQYRTDVRQALPLPIVGKAVAAGSLEGRAVGIAADRHHGAQVVDCPAVRAYHRGQHPDFFWHRTSLIVLVLNDSELGEVTKRTPFVVVDIESPLMVGAAAK